MAEASTRPRPRPRPKPRPVPSSDGVSQSPGASSSTPIPATTAEGDEMFMKNLTRTSRTWQKLAEINKELPTANNDSGSDDDGDSPRKRRNKRKMDADLPRWQRDTKLIRMLSQDLSEESDSEVEFLGSMESPNGTSNANRKAKKKKARSRSRSITPPPEIPVHLLQHTRNVVRQMFDTAPRPASPTADNFDESTDTIIFDPELERIAKDITSQSQLLPHTTANNDEVIISVNWKPHPLNVAGKEDVWQFKMNLDDNFQELFEAVAEEASILTESLIMRYNDKRIYSSATPGALKMWGEAELVACDKVTYEYVHKNPASNTRAPADTFDSGDDDDDNGVQFTGGVLPPPLTSQSQSQDHGHADSDAESGAEAGGKFKLILRSSITAGHDIHLVVQPTTKCGSIVKHFLKKAGVADKYPEIFGIAPAAPATVPATKAKRGRPRKSAPAPAPVPAMPAKDPRLMVDGERLENDTEIGDMDLEDGDLVEVVGL